MAKKVETNKISLTLAERIAISGILAPEGDYSFLILKRDITSKVTLSQDEMKKFGFKTVQGEDGKSWYTWNSKAETSKFQYEFTDLEKNELKLALKKMSEEKKLTDNVVNLYEIFVNNK